MTFLRVHDLQQDLANDFLQLIQRKVGSPKNLHGYKDYIYLKGQEMGFCNDDIKVLLEDYIKEN